MLVYRDAPGVPAATGAFLGELILAARALPPAGAGSHDAAIALAIDVGMFEAAVADAVGDGIDRVEPPVAILRRASIEAAHACLASWSGHSDLLRRHADEVANRLGALPRPALPARVALRVPEGFAYYGLYPETYAEAARQIVAASPVRHAVCVGIRSIGTTLSAFAAAAMERQGCSVATWTVRPAGHPFDRSVRLAPDVVQRLTRPAPDVALVVDEGPGLSGSSFAAATRALEEAGVPPGRIVLVAAWLPDGSGFVSDRASEVWRTHRRVAAPFERVWLASERLASTFGARFLEDISAGRWRRVWRTGPTGPPVQPQHERRKYLARTGGGRFERPRLLKFAGLGRFGRALVTRGEALDGTAAARPSQLAAGFLARDVIEGRPLSAADGDAAFLRGAAEYLVAVAARCTADAPADRESLAALIETNARELLPDAPLSRLPALLASGRALPDAPAVRLDARMLPHEWIVTGRGLVKTDALEHHDDHWYPGPQDLAWDVAGTLVEFAVEGTRAGAFVEAVAAGARDRTLAARIGFYRAAYLSFRAAYCATGARALGSGDDAARLSAAAARYRDELGALLA